MTTFFPVSRVVFDLDGTLVDTAPDLGAAMNHVLDEAGRPPVRLETVRHMVGLGARRLLEAGLEATGGRLSATEEDALLEKFLGHYRENVARLSRPFPGARDLLETLADRGIALGLCTNKPQRLTEALMVALGYDHFFASIVGGDALAVRKPHPAHLRHVLERLGADGPALLVGDSEVDLKTARAAGVPVILVDFGYSTRPVLELGADGVVGNLGLLGTMIRPVAEALRE